MTDNLWHALGDTLLIILNTIWIANLAYIGVMVPRIFAAVRDLKRMTRELRRERENGR